MSSWFVEKNTGISQLSTININIFCNYLEDYLYVCNSCVIWLLVPTLRNAKLNIVLHYKNTVYSFVMPWFDSWEWGLCTSKETVLPNPKTQDLFEAKRHFYKEA